MMVSVSKHYLRHYSAASLRVTTLSYFLITTMDERRIELNLLVRTNGRVWVIILVHVTFIIIWLILVCHIVHMCDWKYAQRLIAAKEITLTGLKFSELKLCTTLNVEPESLNPKRWTHEKTRMRPRLNLYNIFEGLILKKNMARFWEKNISSDFRFWQKINYLIPYFEKQVKT